jgi:hypothetical protein
MAQASQLRQPLPEVIVGSSVEVSERLHRTSLPHALAVTFVDDKQLVIFERVFRQVTAFLPQIIRQRQTDTLEKIVDALLPNIAISDAALAEARIIRVPNRTSGNATARSLPSNTKASTTSLATRSTPWKATGPIKH